MISVGFSEQRGYMEWDSGLWRRWVEDCGGGIGICRCAEEDVIYLCKACEVLPCIVPRFEL